MLLLHLVDCLCYCIRDARPHKYQMRTQFSLELKAKSGDSVKCLRNGRGKYVHCWCPASSVFCSSPLIRIIGEIPA